MLYTTQLAHLYRLTYIWPLSYIALSLTMHTMQYINYEFTYNLSSSRVFFSFSFPFAAMCRSSKPQIATGTAGGK